MTRGAPARPGLGALQGAIVVLIAIVVAFAAMRLLVDVPHLLDGTFPEEEYVQHPWLAYVHIAPGIVYLLGAPVQLAYRARSRSYAFHRRLGRVLLTTGLISGAFAIALGYVMPFAGTSEAIASYVFGSWFLVCLLLAFRAIRRDDVVNHRRWMIRAFAMGVGSAPSASGSVCSPPPACSSSRTPGRSSARTPVPAISCTSSAPTAISPCGSSWPPPKRSSAPSNARSTSSALVRSTSRGDAPITASGESPPPRSGWPARFAAPPESLRRPGGGTPSAAYGRPTSASRVGGSTERSSSRF